MILKSRLRLPIVQLLAALPFFCLCYWVFRLNIDIMRWDEWDIFNLLVGKDNVTLSGLWAPHNEHRLFFPELVMLALAHFSGWDIRWEVWCIVAIALAGFYVIFTQIRKLEDALSLSLPYMVWPVASLLFFSMTQWENWFWGMQISLFLQLSAVIYGCAKLARWREHFSAADFAAAVVCGVVASYSFASGLVYWPVGLLAIAVTRTPQRLRYLGLWSASALAVIAVYFYGYTQPPHSHGPQFGLSHPFECVKFIAIFLGSPLSLGNFFAAMAAGVLGIGLFAVTSVMLWRNPRYRHSPLFFFFLLQCYVLLVAVLISITRLEFSLMIALASRYITLSTPFWIAQMIMIAAMTEPGLRERILCHAWLIGLGVLGVINYQQVGLPNARARFETFRDMQTYFLTHAPEEWAESRLRVIYPWPDRSKKYLMLAREKQLSLFRKP